jgi:hypothetical protein
MPASPLAPGDTETRMLDADLRDVVVLGREIWVSHLRGAEMIRIDADGTVLERRRPADATVVSLDGNAIERSPSTAWRMIPTPDGRAVLAHQMARSTPIDLGDTGEEEGAAYGSLDCGESLERTALTFAGPDSTETVSSAGLASAALPIDIAFSRNGERIALVDGGRGGVTELRVSALAPEVPCDESSGEVISAASMPQPVAAAYGELHDLWIQTREPATLQRFQDGTFIDSIDLRGVSVADTGYDLFNTVDPLTSSGLACASCHPEGRDDGHTWFFDLVGPRRTQSLAGTLRGTAPFHWSGDLPTVGAVMEEVFVRRMGGVHQSAERTDALTTWLEDQPALHVSPLASDAAAVSRGETLFRSAETGCATCHSGAAFTNNQTLDVGTGEPLQVPSLLGVGMRGPWMHDGCAKTLRERFDPACGGGDAHGITSQLTASQIDDLIAYLDTL